MPATGERRLVPEHWPTLTQQKLLLAVVAKAQIPATGSFCAATRGFRLTGAPEEATSSICTLMSRVLNLVVVKCTAQAEVAGPEEGIQVQLPAVAGTWRC